MEDGAFGGDRVLASGSEERLVPRRRTLARRIDPRQRVKALVLVHHRGNPPFFFIPVALVVPQQGGALRVSEIGDPIWTQQSWETADLSKSSWGEGRGGAESVCFPLLLFTSGAAAVLTSFPKVFMQLLNA